MKAHAMRPYRKIHFLYITPELDIDRLRLLASAPLSQR